jgi:hypothetical protein
MAVPHEVLHELKVRVATGIVLWPMMDVLRYLVAPAVVCTSRDVSTTTLATVFVTVVPPSLAVPAMTKKLVVNAPEVDTDVVAAVPTELKVP